MSVEKLIGAVEGGGTKFKAALVREPNGILDQVPEIVAEAHFATTSPEEILSLVMEFFQSHAGSKLQAVGLACFGPLDLEKNSLTYGQITSTPKPGWQGCDLSTILETTLQVPAYIDTDVNGAALGEYLWGAGIGTSPLLYVTVGTGIGGGLLINGIPFHGLSHPELGHVKVPHDWDKDPFNGVCPYHGDCLEGLASGPALLERWQTPAERLPEKHPAWTLEADYLAAALANTILTISPQRIILGGGIMKRSFLFPMIRARVLASLNEYIPHPAILSQIDDYIVPPGLGDRAGVLGAAGLAVINR